MSAPEPFCRLAGIDPDAFPKNETMLLEATLFIFICDNLKEIFREQQKNYFRLMKLTREMEDAMLEDAFIMLLIKDILSTNEYTLEGIARYTDTHLDVIQDILSGRNLSPSAKFFRKIIELHRTVRSGIYQMIIKKFTEVRELN